ncbi:uncharacterized protein RSE6_00834 [Rhynchosporium secalis]|uniref:Protein kinase domain-containing protein n=1 Tax=Rhynchosporium secalis TaxID=38038 RepID=A0A1E1LW91_RHYSE|nr:uncharacterized protein RSE6_00834 [Rhynchosporium secalis]
MPIYHCNPWDFYKPFLKKDAERILVLCDHNTVARVMRTCPCPISTFPNDILQVQYRNFIDYYEAYLFEGQVLTVSENVDFSLKEMLESGLYPTEREIAYIIGQILAGICFIKSRNVGDSTISGRTVRISREGKVKIDPTLDIIDGEGSSADVSSLRPLILSMMNETQETLEATGVRAWSHEVIDFLEATSWATAEELLDVRI